MKQNTNDARRSESLLQGKHTRTQEGKMAAARTKQHEGEEDTGIRLAGRGNDTKGDTGRNSEKGEEREKTEKSYSRR